MYLTDKSQIDIKYRFSAGPGRTRDSFYHPGSPSRWIQKRFRSLCQDRTISINFNNPGLLQILLFLDIVGELIIG